MGAVKGTWIQMPLVGLGTWPLRGKECESVVRTALDLGYRHIDTAEMYGNESEVGVALKQAGVSREEVFITTKVWTNHFRPEAFIAAAEASLRRLRVDYVDLLMLHWPEESVPLPQTLSALRTLVDRGLTRRGGVSNFSTTLVDQSLAVDEQLISTNQIRCAAGHVPFETIRHCRAKGLTVTAYSPLEGGKVSRSHGLAELAKKYGRTPEQIALRYLTQQGVSVIPRTRSTIRLEENLNSTDFDLRREDLEEIGLI